MKNTLKNLVMLICLTLFAPSVIAGEQTSYTYKYQGGRTQTIVRSRTNTTGGVTGYTSRLGTGSVTRWSNGKSTFTQKVGNATTISRGYQP